MEKCTVRKERLNRLEDRLGIDYGRPVPLVLVEGDGEAARFLDSDRLKSGKPYQVVFIVPAAGVQVQAQARVQEPEPAPELTEEALEGKTDEEIKELLEDLRAKVARQEEEQ